MAWVKVTDREMVNLEKVDRVIKSDTVLQDTSYKYSINYDYKDYEGNLVIYEQRFDNQTDRDSFFTIVEGVLQPIKDDRDA